MQEPADVGLLEERAFGVVRFPERSVLRRTDVFASLMQYIEFPCPLGL